LIIGFFDAIIDGIVWFLDRALVDFARSVVPPKDCFEFGTNPEYRYENVKKEWYDQIVWSDYHSKKLGDISYKHDIKIRKILEYHFMPRGYPMRYAQYIGYFSGLGFWVPDGFKVHAEETRTLWNDNPYLRWRKVKIVWIGQESVTNITNVIPLSLDRFLIDRVSFSFGMVDWNIWENLGFYNTANRGLIKANWDKIKEQFRRWNV
jgi:hypothetical protein